MLKYRPEIDGLRAVAVLLVVIYHAGIRFHNKEILPGGFLGVDIFFVISGYLITKIIAREIESNSFSLWNFYERRARRIVPALTVMIGVTSVFCWQYFDIEGFVEFGESIVASVSFVANIFFYFQDSYNAEVSNLKPLLHLWSLGVEEQFYIFYPLLLLLLAKTKRSNLILLVLLALSLFYCEWTSFVNQKFNFFMLPTRAWELLAGGIAAKYECKINREYLPKQATELILLISIAAIVCSAVVFTDNSRLPSLMTFPLIVSTVLLLLLGGPQSLVGKILSTRPLVFIGLVSYSFYLWHQPVLVLLRTTQDRSLSDGESLLAVSLSFLLAVVSYYLVETPARRKNLLSRKVVFSGTFAAFLLLSMFGWNVQAHGGFPSRLSRLKEMLADVDLLRKARKLDDYESFAKSHDVTTVLTNKKIKRFIFNDSFGHTLITAGDSHMETLTTAIIAKPPDIIHEFIPVTHSGTLFLLNGLSRANNINAPDKITSMIEWNQQTLEVIRSIKKPIVILGGRLPLQLEHSLFDNKRGGKEPGSGNPGLVIDTGNGFREATISEIKTAYQHTVNTLLNMGCKVVLIYPIPEVGWHVPKTAIKLTRNMTPLQIKKLFSDRKKIATSYNVFKSRTRSAYGVLDSIKTDHNLLRIYPEKIFCDENLCYTYDDVFFYRDDDHLSHPGAVSLYKYIISKIKTKWEKK